MSANCVLCMPRSSFQDQVAMRAFNYSIINLMALFAFLLADHYLPKPEKRLACRSQKKSVTVNQQFKVKQVENDLH